MRHARRPVPRHVRLSSLLVRMLAQWLLEDGESPWNERFTVTRVELTADGSLARVFILDRLEGNPDADTEAGLAWLRKSEGELRGQIGRELRLRRVPRLQFRYDDAWSGAAALGATFVQLADETRSEPAAESEDAGPDAAEPGDAE
jgi:ribosome-binding factor A